MDLAKSFQVKNLKVGWNKNLEVEGVPFDVFRPTEKNERTLLVLPGWNYSRERWIKESRLESFAKKLNYILILPEMGKSLYASKYYPQTSLKWHRIPGGVFIKNYFIPHLQKEFNLLQSEHRNYLLGLSTGARGVALISLENPFLFIAGASLSGDYDQMSLPEDKLMSALYGKIEYFPERWNGRDNPYYRAKEWKMPLYLAHGSKDPVIPEFQSSMFYDELRNKKKADVPIVYYAAKGYKHDFKFWDSQLGNIFRFFSKINQKLWKRSMRDIPIDNRFSVEQGSEVVYFKEILMEKLKQF